MMNNTTGTLLDNITTQIIPNRVYIGSAILHLIVSVASGLGNPLVIIAVIKFRNLRSTAHVFVVMLAGFDFGIGLVGFLRQYAVLSNVYNGASDSVNTLCKVIAIFGILLRTGDMLSIMFMAIDRFIYITYPLRYPSVVTYNRVAIAVGFTMLYCPISSLITILLNDNSTDGAGCNVTNMMNSEFTIFFMIPEATLISLALIMFYAQIVHLACRKVRQTASTAPNSVQTTATDQLSAKLKITRVISLVIGVYIFTNVASAIMYVAVPKLETTKTVILQSLGEWIWKVCNCLCLNYCQHTH